MYGAHMARHIIETVSDDIDGTQDAKTVTFAFEGKSYEIDLSARNREKLSKALEPYIEHGRSTTSPVRRASGTRSTSTKRHDTTLIREWAKVNGHTVSERGRLSAALVKAYEEATK